MMLVVTFVSLMVHIYTIGYMQDDPGYNRFFSYISLFTFSMLMLVMSNNFMQLFFGWEAVGLVSYLLIGFWYTRPTAIFRQHEGLPGQPRRRLRLHPRHRPGARLLRYARLRGGLRQGAGTRRRRSRCSANGRVSLMTAICILLFIGAMGKSAQVPLHVWLPDSMEGPTPISALIHAATMVTAGIFMVARMSPLFELSDTALSFVIVIGSITALFMGFLGIIQNDIKRVVAYSTLSQLGYMTVALGASAYSVAIFHLMTHAFFKALLFLGRRFGDHRHAPRPGHPQHGRPAQVHADHLDHLADRFAGADRHAVLRRLLLQGLDHRGGALSHIPGAGFAYFA
jgi:NADH-quinone oxidoreductase subunit L